MNTSTKSNVVAIPDTTPEKSPAQKKAWETRKKHDKARRISRAMKESWAKRKRTQVKHVHVQAKDSAQVLVLKLSNEDAKFVKTMLERMNITFTSA